MEKETLKEAAEKFADDCTLVSDAAAYKGFIDGAKWQAERMYSEEDMRKSYNQGIDDSFDIGFSSKDDTNFNAFIKQFKKK